MDEIVPVVYDIAQPTPVPLKDLSAIAVSLQIWRNEIREYRTDEILRKFYPSRINISSKSALFPDLPSVIYDVIDEYIQRFGSSMDDWLRDHYTSIFKHPEGRHYAPYVFQSFDDLAADYTGTIDYVRTAKRMMVCDRITEDEKFAIACAYFFEDDIRRLWPSVYESYELYTICFDIRPQLYYWICRINYDLEEIPIDEDENVDEVMFDYHMVENRPSLEYFWNCLPLENRMGKAVEIIDRDLKLFVTFVLSKLCDQQLNEFVNTEGCKLILKMLKDRLRGNWYLQPTWTLIKNKMTEITFRTLVVEMLKLELASAFEGCLSEPPNWLYHCSVIWSSIAPNLKRSIIEDILYGSGLFENNAPFSCTKRRFVGFLSIILSSATFEQRSTFWRDCWPHLIQGTRSEDLLGIMKLCFENEEEIAQFKGSILAKSENVRIWCSKLLSSGMFEELNDLLNFYWPEVEAEKDYKLQLLQSTFLGERSGITLPLVRKVNEFIVFIDDTFDNKDQSSEFKNQLMSLPATPEILSPYTCSTEPPLEELMKFVDSFASAEDTKRKIKGRMSTTLVQLFVSDSREHIYDRRFDTPAFDPFLSWLSPGPSFDGIFRKIRHKVHW
ncbi:uncharacterized protein LOC135847618 isoform X2 [Planococcus citri]|uniref:uncharacterized protein LOC135847618 isoform X2 n=1 Tax=Planococcus citri TaxID=170843 RepID=UPI0031F740EB